MRMPLAPMRMQVETAFFMARRNPILRSIWVATFSQMSWAISLGIFHLADFQIDCFAARYRLEIIAQLVHIGTLAPNDDAGARQVCTKTVMAPPIRSMSTLLIAA